VDPNNQQADIQLPSTYRADRSDGYPILIYIFTPKSLILCKNCQTVILLQEVHAFCEQFVTLVNEYPDVIHHSIMSDEARFELPGCVNKQNTRYWSEANPNQLHVRPLHREYHYGLGYQLSALLVIIFSRMELAMRLV
jgi:hypothetical protein